MGIEKGYRINYTDFDERADQGIATLGSVIDFEKKANECSHAENFAEATFWFFQHKTYFLNNENSPELHSTIQKCGPEWKNILQFLEEQKKMKKINYFTSWNDIQQLRKIPKQKTKI